MPPMFTVGEICWVAVRNLIENPEHATGDGKDRPAILSWKTPLDRWGVIGTTTNSTYADGKPRVRIPPHLWEDAHPALGHRPGYLWGVRAAVVIATDVHDHVGWASPELRAIAIRHVINATPAQKNDFRRLRPDELREAQLKEGSD
jgi:hypothetical protein